MGWCERESRSSSSRLLAYPGASIYLLGPDGISKTSYEDTEHFPSTRDVLVNRERYLRRLLGDPE